MNKDEKRIAVSAELLPESMGQNPHMDGLTRAQEIIAEIIAARRFPRDQHSAIERIKAECRRPSFASSATFAFPKGKTKDGKKNIVSGGSIRLAEALARSWGNIDYGFVFTAQTATETRVRVYAKDLENNTRASREVVQRHEMKSGQRTKKLTDEREIYELVTNKAMRRLRQVIFELIPDDVVQMAIEQCKRTELEADSRSMKERVSRLVEGFSAFGVEESHLKEFLGLGDLELISLDDLAKLRLVYRAIKDEEARADEFFDLSVRADSFADRFKRDVKASSEKPESGGVEPKKEVSEPHDLFPDTEGARGRQDGLGAVAVAVDAQTGEVGGRPPKRKKTL